MRATLFAVAVGLGSGLVFLVQPLAAKRVLPVLGGTPAVWSTCVLFFQGGLLAGYLLAHAVARCRARLGVLVHLALLALAAVWLPAVPAVHDPPPADGSPVAWLLGSLLAGLAPPYLVVCAAAPLLGAGFARVAGPGQDPYRLYAASNLGSLAALLLFPLAVETSFDTSGQARVWSVVFALHALAVVACGVVSWRVAAPAEPGAKHGSGARSGATRPGPARVARWLVLALVPSVAVLAVTELLTTDITAFPLLWVGPLALYLLTFVVAFAAPEGRLVAVARAGLPLAVAAACALLAAGDRGAVGLGVAVHLVALTAVGLACHGRLAALRPASDQLTRYFVVVAAGGLLGGVLVVLVAPAVLDGLHELPAALLLGSVLGASGRRRPSGGDLALAAAIPLAHLLARPLMDDVPSEAGLLGLSAAVLVSRAAPALLAGLVPGRPVGAAAGLAALLALSAEARLGTSERLVAERTFFGVREVLAQPDGAGTWHHLVHGRIIHGSQYDRPPWSREPTTYFTRSGPLGDVFAGLAARGGPARIGVIGLGIGTVAAYGRPDWTMTFWEIDPVVASLATDPDYFTYLAETASPVSIVIGDGRHRLAAADVEPFDLLILDAFSSTAVPAHLLTTEAVALYLERLAPGGQIVFNVTNAWLDLAGVLAAAARELGLVAILRDDGRVGPAERALRKHPSRWVVLTRALEDLHPPAYRAWVRLAAIPERAAWTDDRSDVLSALRW